MSTPLTTEDFLALDEKEQVTHLLSMTKDDLEEYMAEVKKADRRKAMKLQAKLNSLQQQKSIYSSSTPYNVLAQDVIQKIPLEQIQTNPDQPRKFFDKDKMQKLKEEIKFTKGIIQPIKVEKLADDSYMIIYGERRYRSYLELALEDEFYKNIPCIVVENSTKEEIRTQAIIENIAREDMTLVETALAYKTLTQEGFLQKDIVALSPYEKTTVSRYIQVSHLDETVLDKIQEYQIDSLNLLEPLCQKDKETKTFKLSVEQQLMLLEEIKAGIKLNQLNEKINAMLGVTPTPKNEPKEEKESDDSPFFEEEEGSDEISDESDKDTAPQPNPNTQEAEEFEDEENIKDEKEDKEQRDHHQLYRKYESNGSKVKEKYKKITPNVAQRAGELLEKITRLQEEFLEL